MRVNRETFMHLKRVSRVKKAKAKDNAEFIRKVSGRPKLPTIKSLKKTLWDLNTQVVRKRDGLMCRVCKLYEGYAQNHILPQCEAPSLKFDLDNIFWGCRHCNFDEVHRRATWQRIVLPKAFGEEHMAKLWARKEEPALLRRGELNALIAVRLIMLGGQNEQSNSIRPD